MAIPPANRPKGRSVRNLRMVWGFASRYPVHIAVAALALLVAAGAWSAVPYGFKLIIDKGFGRGAGTTRDLAPWFEGLLALVAVMALATAVRFYFVSWLGERTVADIRLAVHRNLLRLSPGFFEENRPAEITSRITVDTTIIEQVVGTTVSVALRNLIMGIACVVILFALAPKLAGLILLGSALTVLPISVLGRRVRAISTRSQDRIADLGTVTSEVLGAMKIVQAFNQQERETSRFADSVGRVFATAKRRILIRSAMTAIVICLIFGAITMVIWQGAIDVSAGHTTGGTLAAFVLYGGLLAGAFGALSEVYGDLLRAAGASERLDELLRAEPDIRAPAKPAQLPSPARGELEFDNVTFHYPTRRETSALNAFSLKVKARERLRSKFVRLVESVAQADEAAGQWEKAMAHYLRGLEADDLVEAFHLGLMRCYRALGRPAEAIAAFRRLRQTLSVVLGIAPSPAAEALAHELREGSAARYS